MFNRGMSCSSLQIKTQWARNWGLPDKLLKLHPEFPIGQICKRSVDVFNKFFIWLCYWCLVGTFSPRGSDGKERPMQETGVWPWAKDFPGGAGMETTPVFCLRTHGMEEPGRPRTMKVKSRTQLQLSLTTRATFIKHCPVSVTNDNMDRKEAFPYLLFQHL